MYLFFLSTPEDFLTSPSFDSPLCKPCAAFSISASGVERRTLCRCRVSCSSPCVVRLPDCAFVITCPLPFFRVCTWYRAIRLSLCRPNRGALAQRTGLDHSRSSTGCSRHARGYTGQDVGEVGDAVGRGGGLRCGDFQVTPLVYEPTRPSRLAVSANLVLSEQKHAYRRTRPSHGVCVCFHISPCAVTVDDCGEHAQDWGEGLSRFCASCT